MEDHYSSKELHGSILMHYLGHNLMIVKSIVIILCAEHIKRLSFVKSTEGPRRGPG